MRCKPHAGSEPYRGVWGGGLVRRIAGIATELFAVMDGFRIQWLRKPDEIDAFALFDGYLQRFAGNLRP
ncbi:hypothetical protein [Salinicola halophilus]|uniref:hypothetical protein n=1 Tax=Salinicola halophilus TaxID=184065 RepID=UPI0013A64DCA|nr:hypothetical protein [Salinicola halophilus]